MSVFQFQIYSSSAPSVTSGDDVYVELILIGLGILALVIAGLYIVHWISRYRVRDSGNKFKTVVLLVTLPKFRREEEAGQSITKERIQETVALAESFFQSIGGMSAPGGLDGFKQWLFGRNEEFAFEIVATHKLIKFFVSVPTHLRAMIEHQLLAVYSDANIEVVEDYNIFVPNGVILGSYLTLKREHAFPIKTFRKMDTDPLSSLTNVLSKVPEGVGAAYQFIVRTSHPSWRKRGASTIERMREGMTLQEALAGGRKKNSGMGDMFGLSKSDQKSEEQNRNYARDDETIKRLEEKISKAGIDVCARLMVSAKDAGEAKSMLSNMINACAQFNLYENGNAFDKAVPPFQGRMVRRFIHRAFDESFTMVLNTEEMASLWHLPLPWTETPNIQWLTARRAPAPSHVPGPEEGDIELGYNAYRGVKTPVWMKMPDRQRHMYIIGKSGSGKSELIAQLAVQDIKKGHGVAVVDPHGDLVDRILANVPKERAQDVIYFSPSDLDRPIGLNMLEAKDESMKDFAVQEMIAIFYKLFPPEMIGPMFEHYMRNVMLTLMSDQETPGTIAEIPRMFSDEEFQKKWIAKVKDPVVRVYWEKEMAKTSDFHKSETMGYLISKVGRFVENEMMRNIIGQPHSSFDFREVMDSQKILLVNLSKGLTGDVNADLLGMIIVSKLQMAALSRANIAEEDRKDFYLYIDEFQNFITDSIATILSEARKYRLDLTIAHQYVGQLTKNNDTKIRDAVFGNVGTMFTSRIGPEDVELLEKVYAPEFSGYDLINSDKYTWYVKMIVDNSQVKPFTLNFTSVSKGDREVLLALKQLSRLRYGRDRAQVEREIMERSQLGGSLERRQPESPPLSR